MKRNQECRIQNSEVGSRTSEVGPNRPGVRPAPVVLLAILLAVELPFGGFAQDVAANAPEIKVGDELVVMAEGPGKNLRCLPSVAFGKNVYLVVWQEGWNGDGGSSRIYAARVSLDGKLLDSKGIEIAASKTGVQERPRVAFFKDVFLVVWQDLRNGKDCDVLGVRVSPDGKILDAQPIAICAGPRSQVMPDVAADDMGFMVVWQGFQGEENISKCFAARVGADGVVGAATVVAPGVNPKIAWNGKEHLVIFNGLGVRLDGSGKTVDSSRKMIDSACLASLCGVPGKGWALMGHRSLPDHWGWGGPGAQRMYSVTMDGKLAADSPSENYNQLKATPLNWLDSSMNKDGVWPWGGNAVVWDGKRSLAVWQRYRRGGATGVEMVNGDILARYVDGWKAIGADAVPVAATETMERNPSLASGGEGKFLCVYEKMAEGKTVICGRILVSP